MSLIIPAKFKHLRAVFLGLNQEVQHDLDLFIAERISAAFSKIQELLDSDWNEGRKAIHQVSPEPVKTKKARKKAGRKAVSQGRSKVLIDPKSVNGKLVLLCSMAMAKTKDEAFNEAAIAFGISRQKSRNYTLAALLRQVLDNSSRPTFIKKVLEGLPDKHEQDQTLEQLSGWYAKIYPDDILSAEALLQEAKKAGYKPK